MNINDLRAISKPLLAQGAGVSIAKVNCALDELQEQGKLKRSKSPTGREPLTPRESQLVLDHICHRV